MYSKKQLLMLLALILLVVVGWIYHSVSENNMKPTYQSNRFFQSYGEEVYELAQSIERGQRISLAQVKLLPNGVNARYGEEITLLFHALSARNLEAIDVLLAAGADPYMVDTPAKGSTRTFVYYLTLPGHPTDPELGFPFINQLIRLYLKHGGNPNHRLGGANKDPLIAGVALMRNYEGIDILLAAGADPWAESKDADTAMSLLAADDISQPMLNQLINQGYFDVIPYIKLQEFMQWISSYEQRGDEISLANQKIGRRVLKRHPDYPEDRFTERLFQGPIPWQEIANEQ
ncbi:MAG: hypothetical protein Q4G54_08095 [Pelistega sp.]|nr:hypothetical protein [Pelistega sp.]